MKSTVKVLVAICALGIVILVGLHLFLQYGLTKSMRDVVLPRIKQELGIDIRVGHLALNIVDGSFNLEDVEVRNPEGFMLANLVSVDNVYVEVDVMSLLKNEPTVVRQVMVGQMQVNVVRNKKGDLNITHIKKRYSQSDKQTAASSTERTDIQPRLRGSKKPEPLPELLVESMQCDVMLRYVDLKLDQLESILALAVQGKNISTLQNIDAPWGDMAITGSLKEDRTSFVTDLKINLAPITDPQLLSFDLTGKVMEIDPRILNDIYDKAGIQSAPFGLEPNVHCRKGLFENSAVAMELREIKLEDKLADRVGGMASIGSLRFSVPVQGSLKNPAFNMGGELLDAVGGNPKVLVESLLKGVVAKELDLEKPPEDIAEAAVDVLAEKVNEIGESETLKKALKELVDGEASGTQTNVSDATDIIVDLLGEKVDEIGESEAIKNELKNLGDLLFGD